ncbi:MAG: efflux RND transporter periplasmic adaptor subunit [Nannocystaceae bacterium]
MKFRKLLCLAVLCLASGCPSEDPGPASAHASAHAPASVSDPVPEHGLSRVALSPVASQRLGIETANVTVADAARVRAVAGFVTIPPGRAFAVSAPVSGTLQAGRELRPGAAVSQGDVLLRLIPIAPVDRDLRAQARRQRAATRARVELTEARVERLTKLAADRASSARAIEEAIAEREIARADDAAARARENAIKRAPLAADVTLPLLAPQDGLLRTVGAAPGQTVAAGTSLFEVVPAQGLWVRVPVVPSELDHIDADATVTVRQLGGSPDQAIIATPIAAPPSADPVAATVDLFYALDPGDGRLQRPGERVMVTLSYRETEPATVVPRSAVVLDFDGGAWVYTCETPEVFERARVEVVGGDDEAVRLRRGPPAGTCIVSVGALELFGAEFGVKH